jgi:hypothetical protein
LANIDPPQEINLYLKRCVFHCKGLSKYQNDKFK